MTRSPARTAAVAVGASVLLAACGGSGSSDNTASSSGGTVTLTGVVAIGSALGNAAVGVACATGSGTATTNATSGQYSAALSSGAVLPCVLTATSSDGATVLHSVITSGTVANITPLTELLVAEVTAATPSSLTAANVSSLFTADNVSAGEAAVLTLLKDAGIDTTSITDLLTGTLTIGSGGSSYDGVLDALYAALGTAGSTLASLTGTVVAQTSDSGSTSASTDSASSMLAPELLLKARSATCDALRSTDYRMVVPGDAYPIRQLVVDAAAGTIAVTSNEDGSTRTVPLTANGTCRYTTDVAGEDIVVAPSGVIVARASNGDGTYGIAVGVPRQTHALADVAGNWNTVFTDVGDDATGISGWALGDALQTVSGTSAQWTQGCVYAGDAQTTVCFPADISAPQASTLVVADDGYAFVKHDAYNDATKLFAYHAGNGEWFTIGASISTNSSTTTTEDGSGDGTSDFSTRSRTLSLPTAGTTTTSWNVYMDTTTQLSTIATDTTTATIASVDTSAGSFTRTVAENSGPTHPDTLFINDPDDGFDFRDLATGVVASDGNTVTVRRTIYLKTGVGVSIDLQPVTSGSSTSRLLVSVAQSAQ